MGWAPNRITSYNVCYTKLLRIKLLEAINVPSVMIYLSDHGESLGEYGLYLHGAPNALAPDVQRNVPFIFWASDSFLKLKGLSQLSTDKRNNFV